QAENALPEQTATHQAEKRDRIQDCVPKLLPPATTHRDKRMSRPLRRQRWSNREESVLAGRRVRAAAATVVLLVATACSDDVVNSGAGTSPPAPPTTTATATTPPAAPTTAAPTTLPTTATTTQVFQRAISPVTAAELAQSWRSGCPVGPESLRRVSVSYW